MFLKKENIKEIISSYTLNDWQPLLNLIDEIENTKKFYKVEGGKELEDGILELPYYNYYPIIIKFLKVVYDIPIIIDFAWGDWKEGSEMYADKNFDYDTTDIPTKCLLITAIVRGDRFCDGLLGGAFKSGTILKILKSMQKQLMADNPL